MAAPETLRVEVVLGAAVPVVVTVELPAGATLGDAVRASGLRAQAGDLAKTGIWGRHCPPETRLQSGDRVELYCPLSADPKESRRRRARPARGQKPPVDGSVGSR